MSYTFTSEAVSAGHPDKICDQISDALLDLYLSKDTSARTAIETLATTNRIILSGEISSMAKISEAEITDTIRQTVKNIGYDQPGFSWKKLEISNFLHRQSPDIALGVDNNGAGDQGIMFGYAVKEKNIDSDYMPLALHLANRLLLNLNRHRLADKNSGLEPDAKSQVCLRYADDGTFLGIDSLVLSTQHREDLPLSRVKELVLNNIREVIPSDFIPAPDKIYINPTGRFVIGGPDGDTGLTGRKIIVDTYGGSAPHGGGAFSGKDPSKVDRSAAYMLRYLAKNIVAAGLAEKCLLQISYAIGIAHPLSLYINCGRTAKVPESALLDFIKENLDLSPQGIIKHLQLRRPVYTPTAAYGHFGRTPTNAGHFSWEKLDLVEKLQHAF